MPDRIDFSTNPHFSYCEELFTGRTGTPWSATGERTYLRRYRVIVRDNRIGPVSVARCPGLPIPGSFYVTPTEFDLRAFYSNVTIRQEHDDDWQNWIVEITYSTVPPPGGFPTVNNMTPGNQDNPELEPPKIKWTHEVVQHKPRYDLDGNLYQNPNGQQFKDASFPIANAVLSIDRNELEFNAYKAELYSFALNSDYFIGAPPTTVQCYPPDADMLFRGDLRYYRVSYRLKFGYLIDQPENVRLLTPEFEEPDPSQAGDFILGQNGLPIGLRSWQPTLLNEGTMARKTANDPPKRSFRDSTVRKLLLDADGVELGEGENPFFIRYRQFRKLSFAELIVNGLA